jgi:hypothetical protein
MPELRVLTVDGHVDVAIAPSVVPVIVGLVVLALRRGLSTICETPVAVALGVLISLGYTLAGRLPGGTDIADAQIRGVAIGLTSAGLIATIRRFTLEERASRR